MPAVVERAAVAWAGITVRVPHDWSPTVVSGDGTRGHLKVMSPDTRSLEVRWERPSRPVSPAAALQRYFTRLRKDVGDKLTIRERPKRLDALRPGGQEAIPYAWEAECRAVGCIWRCAECGRLVLAELTAERGADLSAAVDIIRGIRDHSEGGWTAWALYGLTIAVPERYRMERHTLLTGHQRFELRDRGTVLTADRWALAELALRDTTLREWFERRERAELSRFAYEVDEAEVRGHQALRFTGRVRIAHLPARAARGAAALALPALAFDARVWHCPESNRIYSLRGELPGRDGLLEQVAACIECH